MHKQDYIKLILIAIFSIISSLTIYSCLKSTTTTTEHYILKETGVLNKVYQITFSDTISDVKHYLPLLDIINNADSDATIELRLRGNGGDAETLMLIVEALQRTQATTIAHVRGNVYSAHAYLALATQHLFIHGDPLMMLHHTSAFRERGSICVKYLDPIQNAACTALITASSAQTQRLIERILHDKIPAQAIADVLVGKDVYLSPAEIVHAVVIR